MRKHSISKRILVSILAIIMAIGTMAVVPPSKAEAASGTLVTDAVIKTRINELNSKLGGTYFNTTHTRSTCGSKCGRHGNSCCSNANVIKQTWFKRMFGFSQNLSTNQFPITYTTDSYLTKSAQSCAGFAAFAEWYIFRTSDSSSVTVKKIGNFKSTKANWEKNAKMGDLIRWNGHSFIFISCTDSGVKVLDCNWSGKDSSGKTANNCMVQIHTIKYGWSGSKYTISRSATRANCKHTSGYQTEWNGSTYVATVCKNCGSTHKHTVSNSSGLASTVKTVQMKAEPYSDSPTVYTVLGNRQVKILGQVTNAYGNTWFKVSYTFNGTEFRGFIYKGSLTAFVCPR